MWPKISFDSVPKKSVWTGLAPAPIKTYRFRFSLRNKYGFGQDLVLVWKNRPALAPVPTLKKAFGRLAPTPSKMYRLRPWNIKPEEIWACLGFRSREIGRLQLRLWLRRHFWMAPASTGSEQNVPASVTITTMGFGYASLLGSEGKAAGFYLNRLKQTVSSYCIDKFRLHQWPCTYLSDSYYKRNRWIPNQSGWLDTNVTSLKMPYFLVRSTRGTRWR